MSVKITTITNHNIMVTPSSIHAMPNEIATKTSITSGHPKHHKIFLTRRAIKYFIGVLGISSRQKQKNRRIKI